MWIFVQSDGIVNTFRFVWKSLFGKFYRLSRTLCLYAERYSVKELKDGRWSDFHSRVIYDWKELRGIDFDRLKLLPCKKWLDAGSIVVIIFQGDIPVGFGWTHFGCHTIEYVGSFDMGTTIAWLGPSFVHRKYRGKGLQKLVIQECVRNAPKQIKTFISSVNDKNSASLISFEKCGFKVGMQVNNISGLFARKGVEIRRLDDKSESYLRISR